MTTLRDKLMKARSDLAPDAQKVQVMIFETIEQTRNLSSGFYPVEVESWLAGGLAGTHRQTWTAPNCVIQIESDENPAYAELEGPLAIGYSGLPREAVQNAIQHARPKQIVIRLLTIADQLNLVIQDDGAGYPANVHDLNGIGLTVMNHRARMIGGALTLANGPHGGAVVTCSILLALFESRLKLPEFQESTLRPDAPGDRKQAG